MSLTASGELLASAASAADRFAGLEAGFAAVIRGDQALQNLEMLPAANQREGEASALVHFDQQTTLALQQSKRVPPQGLSLRGVDFSTVWLSEIERTTLPSGETDAGFVSHSSELARQSPMAAATAWPDRGVRGQALGNEGDATTRPSLLTAENLPADGQPSVTQFAPSPGVPVVPDLFSQARMIVAPPAIQGEPVTPGSLARHVAVDEPGALDQNSVKMSQTSGPSGFLTGDLSVTRLAEYQPRPTGADSPTETTIRLEAIEPKDGVASRSVLAVASGHDPLAIREAPRGRSANVVALDEAVVVTTAAKPNRDARPSSGIPGMPSLNLGRGTGQSELAQHPNDRLLEIPAWLPAPLQKMLRTGASPAAFDGTKPEPVQRLTHTRLAGATPDDSVRESVREILPTHSEAPTPGTGVPESVQQMLLRRFAAAAPNEGAPEALQRIPQTRFAVAAPDGSVTDALQQARPTRVAPKAADARVLEPVQQMLLTPFAPAALAGAEPEAVVGTPQRPLEPRPALDAVRPAPLAPTRQAHPAGVPASAVAGLEAIQSDLEGPNAFDPLFLHLTDAAQKLADPTSARLQPPAPLIQAPGAQALYDPMSSGINQPRVAMFVANPVSESLSRTSMPSEVAFRAEILAGAENGPQDSPALKSRTDELQGRRARLEFLAAEQHSKPDPGVTATASRQKLAVERTLAAADSAPPAPAVGYAQTPSGSRFTTDGSRALKPTPNPAATLLDHPLSNEPGTTGQPVRAVTVKLHSEEHGAASVLLADRAGRVQVTVRAADPVLASSLQGDLDSLRQGLESQGLQVSLWKASSRGYDERTGRDNAPELQRHYEADQSNRYQHHSDGGRRQNWHHEDELGETD